MTATSHCFRPSEESESPEGVGVGAKSEDDRPPDTSKVTL
eukprot:CAMPEP_0175974412 /NCGR_PEP_ID=MMETSP0108-20121206/43367_1 /TAXON_ID=195067 ORGANISM="Goniomonas pacifica, Strain CCMP1869" /NCGR_SAMPLE_ID=MMETSP0108 /ASSEMBLY_ACC=CAM_ASM_000204 /LENGTH=39 /DNA_ID= /DNA_START= /DNA_END= /DNA_ORIENTATION=